MGLRGPIAAGPVVVCEPTPLGPIAAVGPIADGGPIAMGPNRMPLGST